MRTATAMDLPSLVAIENVTQVAPWSDDIFQQCFKAGYDCWVIEEGQQIIAFIVMSSALTGESHILNLGVDPAYQQQGFGYALMRHAVSHAKKNGMGMIYLEVRRSNRKAIKLYEKMDFIQIGERKDYYPALKGREDALIFAIDLGV